jgi:hypothetical protein
MHVIAQSFVGQTYVSAQRRALYDNLGRHIGLPLPLVGESHLSFISFIEYSPIQA